jgi:hypothetical protein
VSDSAPAEAANKDIAAVKVAKRLSFDEKVDDLARFIQREPLIREIDYQVLRYCLERRDLPDIEERIAGYPEFKAAARDQYSLITELVNHYGLKVFELDKAGNPVLEADKTGLSENEIDDLVIGYAYQTTEVGKAVNDKFDPKHRLVELFDIVPQRYDTYIEILEFLCDKHSFAEVDSLLRGRDILFSERAAGDQAIQSSVFVDKLERAGGIFFNDGWQITEAGRELLATIAGRA